MYIHLQYIFTGHASDGTTIGHAAYFPNGGLTQAGCNKDWKCDHWRSVEYYAESLKSNKFVAKKCDSYNNYKAGKCSRNSNSVMGGLNLDTK